MEECSCRYGDVDDGSARTFRDSNSFRDREDTPARGEKAIGHRRRDDVWNHARWPSYVAVAMRSADCMEMPAWKWAKLNKENKRDERKAHDWVGLDSGGLVTASKAR